MTCQPLSDSLHTAQFTQSSAKPAAEDEQLLNCQVGTTPVAADAFEITSITMSAASFSSPVPNNNIFFFIKFTSVFIGIISLSEV